MPELPSTESARQTLISATCEVFSTMLGVEAQAGEALAGGEPASLHEGVFATVGLAGPCIGSGTLSLPSSLACQLAGQFMMSEYDQVNTEVLDAVGELANMIIGSVKTALEAEMGQIGLSIPTVLFGKNFVARSKDSAVRMSIPFDCGGAILHVGLQLSLAASDATAKPGFVMPHIIAG